MPVASLFRWARRFVTTVAVVHFSYPSAKQIYRLLLYDISVYKATVLYAFSKKSPSGFFSPPETKAESIISRASKTAILISCKSKNRGFCFCTLRRAGGVPEGGECPRSFYMCALKNCGQKGKKPPSRKGGGFPLKFAENRSRQHGEIFASIFNLSRVPK